MVDQERWSALVNRCIEAKAEDASGQKWTREAYLSAKHMEDIEPIWLRYFEAEHELH